MLITLKGQRVILEKYKNYKVLAKLQLEVFGINLWEK